MAPPSYTPMAWWELLRLLSGHRPAGTDFGYHVDAKFSGDSGTGKRVEGRPCDVTFAKVK
jgi:hypothetical protein